MLLEVVLAGDKGNAARAPRRGGSRTKSSVRKEHTTMAIVRTITGDVAPESLGVAPADILLLYDRRSAATAC